uniref:Uncharacterized protein n=1 Tax=virus sp. ctoYX9 TaxID=2825822 RepID=A0A8S5RPS9_9VIRU|nr:MAG TPA: hypothetical protein [virus sp. ctoYX9]
MQLFGCHVPSIDYLRLSRFGEYGFFRHVKFFGDKSDYIVGKFCNLWHNKSIFMGNEQYDTPRVIRL